ncbi:MAG: bifunctional UDP-N-acetylglucosamine diphosphorylase/glucosamine-1-phosphate N-acetyltransferase GlmU [Gammaproteobacteria bacterium]
MKQFTIMSDLSIIILAAGKGTRMHSNQPKVLHPLAGKPWILHLVENVKLLNPERVFLVVSPDNRAALELALSGQDCSFIEQKDTLGTAHAVLQALPHVKSERTLVLLGDVPLLKTDTLREFLAKTPAGAVGMLTFEPENPTGLGRVMRNNKNEIICIKEEKDASPTEKAIREAAVGGYVTESSLLNILLPKINNQNAAGEYYLPDLIPLAIAANHAITGYQLKDSMEGFGINTKYQLALAERYFQRQQVENLMGAGLTVMDPNRLDIRGKVTIGQDVIIDINVIVEGEVFIGNNTTIGANCILRDVHIGENVNIKPFSIIENSIIENNCIIGPYARIRPDCHLHQDVHVGNFVELKKSHLGSGTKVNHLSYVGDSEVGENVNVGAGTITCNYDGVAKHKTIIKSGAFIGSNSALVAPVIVGENAVIGAGTVLTKDAPDQQLTVGRAKQISVKNWRSEEK